MFKIESFMDFSKPIAKRTRAQVLATFLSEIEARKKANKPPSIAKKGSSSDKARGNRKAVSNSVEEKKEVISLDTSSAEETDESCSYVSFSEEEDGDVESSREKGKKGSCFNKLGNKKKVGSNSVEEENEALSLDTISGEETDESCSIVSFSEEEDGNVASVRQKRGSCFDKVGDKKKVGTTSVEEEDEVISLDTTSDEETDDSCSYDSFSEEGHDDETEVLSESVDDERVIKRRKVQNLDVDANDVEVHRGSNDKNCTARRSNVIDDSVKERVTKRRKVCNLNVDANDAEVPRSFNEKNFVTRRTQSPSRTVDESVIKRRKECRLDADVNDLEVPRSNNKRNSIARRTRSHFGSNSFSKKNIGTNSRPIHFDLCMSDEDNNGVKEAHNLDDENNSECIGHKANSKDIAGDKEELHRTSGVDEFRECRKRKRCRPPKDELLFDLLVKSIWEKGENFQQQKEGLKVKAEEPLPRKFNFGVGKLKPVEKTDDEKLIDVLWSEMDFVLQSCQLGSYPVDGEDINGVNIQTDLYFCCSQGKHDFFLDEQIGITCRICRLVKTEIRYVLPHLDTILPERSTKKASYDEGVSSMWEKTFFQDADDLQGSLVRGRGTVWDIFPRIRDKLYSHQKEGFEFLWRNIAGGIELDKVTSASSDGTGGCVISHAPGTGKTLLTIVFLQSYMEVFKECRPVIIAPYSMLLTWEQELKTWNVKTPFHNLNSPEFSGKEDEMALKLIIGKSKHKKWNRLVKLLSWSKGKSILGVSYPLFVQLAGKRLEKDEEKSKPKMFLRENEANEISRILLEKPSLLVLDEGHTPRNERSHIWKVLDKVKTERRIILSGTPFQNNFKELGNTLSLVRPKFLESILSSKVLITSNVKAKKEARKEWALLTKSINNHADDRILKKIRDMVAPFVHVHKGSILKDNLPGLKDCVVVLNPPSKQMELLEKVQVIDNQLELGHAVSLVSIHPSLMINCGYSRSQKDVIDGDLLSSETFRLNYSEGVKTRFLMELIRLSETKNEKVLVFSQFIDPLSLIKDQLYHHFSWTEGDQILQMDGTDNMRHRQSMINLFNDPYSNVKVLLASTKACREGISLIGASRIVLLDVVWNPSVERQAISRAYRLGQKNIVYTYHLITLMELEKYRKQVSKDRLSELVFSSTHSKDDGQKRSTVQDDAILEAMVGNEKLKKIFEDIIYQPKESDLIETF